MMAQEQVRNLKQQLAEAKLNGLSSKQISTLRNRCHAFKTRINKRQKAQFLRKENETKDKKMRLVAKAVEEVMGPRLSGNLKDEMEKVW